MPSSYDSTRKIIILRNIFMKKHRGIKNICGVNNYEKPFPENTKAKKDSFWVPHGAILINL